MPKPQFPLAPKFRLSQNLDGSESFEFEVIDPNDEPIWASLIGLTGLCLGGIFIGCLAAFMVIWLA
jgi:hypothetical protein